MKILSAEIIAIIATGVALAGLQLVGQHRMEDLLIASQHRMEDSLIASQHRMEDSLIAGQHRLEDRMLAVETEQARINALLEGADITAPNREDSTPVHR